MVDTETGDLYMDIPEENDKYVCTSLFAQDKLITCQALSFRHRKCSA